MAENVKATENTNDVKSKLVFNPRLMKYLIEEKGMADQIIGLKPNKENHDMCVFVMKDSLSLRDSMQEYAKISRQRRAERMKDENTNTDEPKEGPQQED